MNNESNAAHRTQSFKQSNSIVAFIDILGFKDIVKANNKRRDNMIFNDLQSAIAESYKKAVLQSSQSLSFLGKNFKEDFNRRLKYRVFSDNLFISFDYNDDKSDYEFAVYWVASMSVHYQRNMLQKRFYVRGAIADGQSYCDDHVIFSEALIKAYELETKIAKYPRVIVEKNIIKTLNKISKEHIFRKVLKKYLVKDWTGTIFLNPFKMVEAIDSMFQVMPEIIPLMQKYIDDRPIIVTDDLSPDMSDDFLNDFVADDLNLKIRKHKKVYEVYEKYLWLREFVDWNSDEYYSSIEFDYVYR